MLKRLLAIAVAAFAGAKPAPVIRAAETIDNRETRRHAAKLSRRRKKVKAWRAWQKK